MNGNLLRFNRSAGQILSLWLDRMWVILAILAMLG